MESQGRGNGLSDSIAAFGRVKVNASGVGHGTELILTEISEA